MAKRTPTPVKPPKPVKPADLTVSELSDIVRHNLAVNLLHPAPETDDDDDNEDDAQ